MRLRGMSRGEIAPFSRRARASPRIRCGSSLPSVERTARDELGLVTPPNDRVYYVSEGEVR